jgi:hypothetical protein
MGSTASKEADSLDLTLTMPVRIRLDPYALAEGREDVVAAVGKALGRSLPRGRAALRRFGAGDEFTVTTPRFSWSGDGLSLTREGDRAALEKAVRAAIVAALARDASRRRGATRVAEAPRERADARRRRAPGGYVVDSYDGGAALVAVEPRPEAPPALDWWVSTGLPRDVREIAAQIALQLKMAGGGAISGASGLLQQRPDGWMAWISGDGFRTSTRARYVTFARQSFLAPVLNESGEVSYERRPLVPPARAARLTEHPLPPDTDARIAMLLDLLGPGLRNEARSLFARGDSEELLLLDEASFEERLDAVAAKTVEQLAASIPPDRTAMLRFDFGDGVAFNIAMPRSLFSDMGLAAGASATILPLAEVAHGLDLGAAGGGAGQAARGRGAGETGDFGDGGQDGRQDGGGSRYGIFGEGAASGRLFPSLPERSEAMACEPFLGSEIDPKALGALGDHIRRLCVEIAERLGMGAPCGWPATFCVMAAKTIGAHAEAVGRAADTDWGGDLTRTSDPARAGARVSFRPVSSPAIQLLQRLSQAARKTHELLRLVMDTHLARGELMTEGPYARDPRHWAVEFSNEAGDALTRAVGLIFTSTCQVVMLQLLVSSADQILARLRNIRPYAQIFNEILVRTLSDVGEMRRLRDELNRYNAARRIQTLVPQEAAIVASVVPATTWIASARALADACVATEGFAHLPGSPGQIVEDGGVARIRDSNGFLWTQDALEQQIAQSQGLAETIDPLIQQIADVPGVIARFRANPASAEALLEELLRDMLRENANHQEKARGDRLFGVQVEEATRSQLYVSGGDAPFGLQGVHLLAHQQIGSFFHGSRIYERGVRHVLLNEISKREFVGFIEFTALVVLSVVCPPAAFVAGVGIAAYDVHHALGRRDLYRSLIDPSLVLNRAEVELGVYIAYAGLALSLLPEAGTAIKAGVAAGRGVAVGGLRAGARAAASSVVRSWTRQVTHALERELLPALVQEAAMNALMDKLIEAALPAVLDSIQREIAIHGAIGGQAGALRYLEDLERRMGHAAAAPLPPHLSHLIEGVR